MFERFRNFLHLSLVLTILIGLIFLTSRFSSSEPAAELAKTGETPRLAADATRPFGSEAPHLSATQIPALPVSIVPSARFNFAERAKEQGILDQFVTDKFNTQLGWQGVLVFAEDNTVCGPNSFIGGWKTYLVLQRYGTSKITAELEAFRVSGPKDQWVYKPYFSPDGRQDEQAKMIIRDGYKPAPSPNGRWIAYFGSKNHRKPQKPWTGRAAGEYLLLADLSGKNSDNRVVIRKETGLDFPILRWTPDSRTLLIIKPSITDNAAIEAQISGYDTEKSRLEHLAGDKITKADSMNWNDFRNPFFRVVEVAQNGAHVFYELMLFGDSPSTNGTFLKATNLHTGSVTTLARTGSVHRLDWHDTSAQLGQASQ